MTGPFRPDAFAERAVLVTGGTTGIGLAIAQAFAALGADVTAAGVLRGNAPTFEAEVRLAEFDVTSDLAVQELLASHNRLDVLVNCAGVIQRQDEYRIDVFQDVLNVNLLGTMRCCSAARNLLSESSGSIVNIASMTSFFGSGHAPAYGASKAAVAQLTKSLAIAYAPGVRVNAVAPGWIRTQLTEPLSQDADASRRIVERTPFGRWGVPGEVCGAVLFLASEASAFVTGAIIPIDGGYSAC